MARTDLIIPSLGSKFIDLRDAIPGDSFEWSWIRPFSVVKYLAIHHSASPDTQTPVEIANYHINNNSWGGIGYHFVISKEGIAYYVGDIATARANVANLNDQVIGICLIGNFTEGRVPTSEQIDSVHKLCDFFINNYANLANLNSWDVVMGHKELPGQATACPGDDWPAWKQKIVSGVQGSIDASLSGTVSFNLPSNQPDRGAQITENYRTILGRDPDMGGLQTYTNSPMTVDQIRWAMITSIEHQNLLRAAKEAAFLQGQVSGLQETVNHQKSQIDSLQMSLATVNGQLISLKDSLTGKDAEINQLKTNSNTNTSTSPVVEITKTPTETVTTVTTPPIQPPKPDPTLTILQALFNLYKFVFIPGGK